MEKPLIGMCCYDKKNNCVIDTRKGELWIYTN